MGLPQVKELRLALEQIEQTIDAASASVCSWGALPASAAAGAVATNFTADGAAASEARAGVEAGRAPETDRGGVAEDAHAAERADDA